MRYIEIISSLISVMRKFAFYKRIKKKSFFHVLSIEKYEIVLREKFFWKARYFLKKFDFNDRCQNKIEDNFQKYTVDSVSHKIDFMTFGPHRGRPQAWKLNELKSYLRQNF